MLRQFFQQRYWTFITRYLDKRQPAAPGVILSQKLIFILPSRYGCWFMLLMILLYLLGTNYQNNLILLVMYLMLSLFLLSIVLTYQNMSMLKLQCHTVTELFSGESGYVSIRLMSDKPHYMLQMGFIAQPMVEVPELTASIALPLKAVGRGCFSLPRIKISTVYPFGLWRSWSYVALQQKYWVYPAMLAGQQISELSQQSTTGQQNPQPGDTIVPYRSGDSLRYLLWKRLARDPYNPVIRQEQYSAQPDPHWIEVPALSGEAKERALSQACQQLVTLAQGNALYGLKLPRIEVAQSSGPAHLQRCLQELALC